MTQLNASNFNYSMAPKNTGLHSTSAQSLNQTLDMFGLKEPGTKLEPVGPAQKSVFTAELNHFTRSI